MRVTLVVQEKQLQNQIFKLLDEMEANQQQFLQRRLLESNSSVHNTIILLIWSFFTASATNPRSPASRKGTASASAHAAGKRVDSPQLLQQCFDDDILHISDNAATAKFFKLPPETIHQQLTSQMEIPQKYISEWIYHYCQSESTGTPIHFEYADDTGTDSRWLSVTVYLI